MSASINNSVGMMGKRGKSSPSSSFAAAGLGCRFCRYGVAVKVVMCWTKENAGRRFLGCPNYGARANTMLCGFMVWYDEPTPERYRKIIYGLVKKLDSEREGFQYGSEKELVGAVEEEEEEEESKSTKHEEKTGKLSLEKRRLGSFPWRRED